MAKKISFAEMEAWVKNTYLTQAYKILADKTKYVKIEFQDQYIGSPIFNIGDPIDKMNQLKQMGGCVDPLTVLTEKRFTLTFFIGNLSRYFYTKYILGKKEFDPNEEYIGRIIKCSRHESFHVWQDRWLFKHTSDFVKSLKLMEEYCACTPYKERSFEVEAYRFQDNKPVRHFRDYMSQFIV